MLCRSDQYKPAELWVRAGTGLSWAGTGLGRDWAVGSGRDWAGLGRGWAELG